MPDVPETLEVTVIWLDGEDGNTLPLLLSDKGYGILPAAASPVFC
mgnify:CR=1 FL=1